MDQQDRLTCTAFEGFRRIASGAVADVALKTKKVIDRGERGPILIFGDVTGEQVEVDFRGTVQDVLKRIEKTTSGQTSEADSTNPAGEGPRGPGRPRLGVVGAKSHCCRGTGTGSTSNRGVHRSRCESWWRRPDARTRAAIACDGRKSRLTGSCRQWPAICRDSRRRRGRFLRGTPIVLRNSLAVGRRMFGRTLGGWCGRSCRSRRRVDAGTAKGLMATLRRRRDPDQGRDFMG